MINPVAQKQIDYIAERCKEIKPLVVIHSITYNHELYLKDALEGFVMQKTDFPFIAVVHEDASTDKTAEILKEYADKYPDIIFPIYEKENQYSKRDGSLTQIMNYACEVTGAKYVALCEGDDYWIDPFKLQKQVDFLENHPDYSMCFHYVDFKNETNRFQNYKPFIHIKNKDYTSYDILKKWTVPTCSSVLRNSILKNVPENKKFQYGDDVLWLTCLKFGNIRGMTACMAVYRRNPTSFTAQDENELYKTYIIHCIGLKESFPNVILNNIIDNKISLLFGTQFLKDLKSCKLPIGNIKFGFKYFKFDYISYMIRFVFIKLKSKIK